jgi:hypothetical protein
MKEGAVCLLACEDRREVGVGPEPRFGPPPALLRECVVARRLHAVRSDVYRILARGDQQIRQEWRQGVIDEKSHAERGSVNSRSITEDAANRRHSRMSSV